MNSKRVRKTSILVAFFIQFISLFLLFPVQEVLADDDYTDILAIANEVGDYAKPIVASDYFDWTNWQKDSVIFFKAIPKAFADSTAEKRHETVQLKVLGSTEGDTIAQAMIAATGYVLIYDGKIVASDILEQYFLANTQALVQIDYPAIGQWTNVPHHITANGIPWQVNYGSYKQVYGFWAINDAVFHSMSIGNLDAGLRLNVKENQEASTTWEIRYGMKKVPNSRYSWKRSSGFWQFQPRIVKSTFRALDEPNKELRPVKTSGKGLAMADSVSASAENIEGYIFDHYDYIDQYGVKKSGTTDTWQGKMDITKKGLVWWYKKAEPLPEIKKEANRPEVSVGQAITYKLTVSNTGNGPLTQPLISDRLPKDSVTKPVDITLELANGTKRKLLEGKGNANAQGEYYEYFLPAENPAAENLLQIHLGDVLKVNEIKNITYTTTLIKGVNGETKVNTATLTGVNTTAQPSASASILVNNGTLKLSVPDTVTFGEAKLPKSIGTNLQRNSGFQISVIDSRVQKDDFYVTAIESQAFINKNTGASLTAPLIFKEVNNVERKISASDSAIVFQPNVKKQNGTVNYQSAWAADQGLMFKVPTTAQLGTYNGEITWNLLTAP